MDKPLIVITGPTASGKTSLAVDLAEKFNGEIICADSRTVYRGLDIGTAKPTESDKKRAPHWGLDLVNPGDYFSVADFKKYADNKIEEIRSRNHIPFLVGGTGLYIDAVIFDYKFGKVADLIKREALNKLTLTELRDYCKNNNIALPENDKNKRYLVRNIERNDTNLLKKDCPIKNTIIIGILTDRALLRTRIEGRSEQLFKDGAVEEASIMGEKFGWDNEALKGNIYPLAHQYLLGKITLDDMISKYSIIDWRLAKRQLTWMKRNKFIKWLNLDDAKIYISTRLAKLV